MTAKEKKYITMEPNDTAVECRTPEGSNDRLPSERDSASPSSEKTQSDHRPGPDMIKFVGDFNSEIKTHLKITNKSDMKQAFKIKCTRNDLFKIRPATGILDYNQTSNITLTYKPNGEVPENDKHHFGVYHIPAPEGCTCEGAWSEHYGPPQGEFRLKVDHYHQ
ncbi:hypothetical protein V3C99_009430 [Haemonchus contortus]